MKSKVIFGLASMAVVASAAFSSCTEKAVPEPTLKEMFQDKFLMGVAINENQASGLDSLGAATAAKHFNAIVPENVMKSAEIHPEGTCWCGCYPLANRVEAMQKILDVESKI